MHCRVCMSHNPLSLAARCRLDGEPLSRAVGVRGVTLLCAASAAGAKRRQRGSACSPPAPPSWLAGLGLHPPGVQCDPPCPIPPAPVYHIKRDRAYWSRLWGVLAEFWWHHGALKKLDVSCRRVLAVACQFWLAVGGSQVTAAAMLLPARPTDRGMVSPPNTVPRAAPTHCPLHIPC